MTAQTSITIYYRGNYIKNNHIIVGLKIAEQHGALEHTLGILTLWLTFYWNCPYI